MRLILFFGLLQLVSCASYPEHWWQAVHKDDLQWWEIGPQAGEPGKTVILSKRNELGILSNFSHAPFVFDGVKYPNVEALWQSMKYPELKSNSRSKLKNDPRVKVIWPHKREEVVRMDGFTAKAAGDAATKIMRKLGIDWVSYNGEQMPYWTSKKGKHYKLIRMAMMEKLKQNPKVKEVLMRTKNLILLPDHHTKADDPPAWKYNQIWMEIRTDLQKAGGSFPQ